MHIILISNGFKFQQNLAKDEYESNFVSAVVPPGEIGVKFDDIGALEDVKKALNELVILPMSRPELFSRGNLLRVMILFIICMVLGSFSLFQSMIVLIILTFFGRNLKMVFLYCIPPVFGLLMLKCMFNVSCTRL